MVTQVIAIGGQLPEPVEHIEEPRLIHYRPYPNRDQESESSHQSESEKFVGVSSCLRART